MNREQETSIALGMSGGVDSSTAAAYLLQEGYEVVGVTFLFKDDEASKDAAHDAAEVCAMMGIRHVTWPCTDEFEKSVIKPFLASYASGMTPSPCVVCNASCKVPQLIAAADELGCAFVATGHYARVARLEENGRFVVKAALDHAKDQSYMLSQLTQDQLSRLILPLGGTTKASVRIAASELGLPVAAKKDSQDICFIEGDLDAYLQEHGVEGAPGDIVDSIGKAVGCHEGLFRYTIGQRKGIGVAAPRPYYVIGKDVPSNTLIVGHQEDACIDEAVIAAMNWQAFEELVGSLDCMVKLRYRSTPIACAVLPAPNDADRSRVRACFVSPQTTTAPGQYGVFYQGETVLGGGVIESVVTHKEDAGAQDRSCAYDACGKADAR